jgi:hypothetical protein
VIAARALLVVTLVLLARTSVASPATGAGPLAGAEPISYLGGRVLHATRTHAIFWQPAGSGLRFDAGYVALVMRFLRDIAAASHSTDNVLAMTGQYTDSGGPAAYASRFAGAVRDGDSLPTNGCHEPASSGPSWTVCLSDAELQHELEHVAASRRLPVGGDNVFLLVTPLGLGSCTDESSSSCALGGSSGGYCGYHSVAAGGLLYAVIPYNAVAGHCLSGGPRPNGSPADPALSTVVHELAETITDPFGDGWATAAGKEIADVCLTHYGPALGGHGRRRYNETIGRDRYWLQELYSRIRGRCEPRPQPDHAAVLSPARVTVGEPVQISASAGQPGGAIVSYAWRFGGGGRGRGQDVTHAWTRPGDYRIELKVVDAAGNWADAARSVRVTNSGGAIARYWLNDQSTKRL